MVLVFCQEFLVFLVVCHFLFWYLPMIFVVSNISVFLVVSQSESSVAAFVFGWSYLVCDLLSKLSS